MSLILHIETATEICSVALAKEGRLILVKEAVESRSHASQTAVLIDEIIKEAGVSYQQLNAVAVSRGPGSYTGLRIGVASAKGLCFALEKPLIAVDTLQAMAGTFLLNNALSADVLLVPLIDARREEVYGAVLDQQLKYIENVKAEILNGNSFLINPDSKRVLFGDGATKAIAYFDGNEKVIFDGEFRHSSSGMISLAFEKFQKKNFEDIAYFEPYYLKEFVGNFPKASK